jgi:hypothetical protein
MYYFQKGPKNGSWCGEAGLPRRTAILVDAYRDTRRLSGVKPSILTSSLYCVLVAEASRQLAYVLIELNEHRFFQLMPAGEILPIYRLEDVFE